MRMGHLDHLLSGLEAYGLSKKEAEIYLALLQKGPSTILEIAKKTHQPRTTLYPMLEYVKEPYLVESIIARRIELGIKSYQIIVEGDKTKIIIDSDKEQLRESRLLPKDALIPATLIQFGTEVAFMTTRRENAMIIMTSGDVAITFKTMFDLLWKCSKNPYGNV